MVVNYCGRCGHSVAAHFADTYGCDSCNCTRKQSECGEPNGYDRQKPEPVLSLLIVDMGDCCVVKVERGDRPDIAAIYWQDKVNGICGMTFADIRAALSQDKPVPRIERDANDRDNSTWRFICAENTLVYPNWYYHALTTINGGKPLPIWTDTGEWTQLIETGPLPFRAGQSSPVGIWRYEQRLRENDLEGV